MSINNGQDANEENFNKAFGSKMASNTYAGIQSLDNALSGERIANLQKCVNTIMQVVGMSELAENNGDYENNNYIADGDPRKTAISKLDAALKAVADQLNALSRPSFDQSVKTIASGGALTVDPLSGLMLIKLEGETGPVTTSTPFGANPEIRNHAVIILRGTSTANAVTLSYADVDGGALLNGDRVLERGVCVMLQWDATDKRFYQVA